MPPKVKRKCAAAVAAAKEFSSSSSAVQVQNASKKGPASTPKNHTQVRKNLKGKATTSDATPKTTAAAGKQASTSVSARPSTLNAAARKRKAEHANSSASDENARYHTTKNQSGTSAKRNNTNTADVVVKRSRASTDFSSALQEPNAKAIRTDEAAATTAVPSSSTNNVEGKEARIYTTADQDELFTLLRRYPHFPAAALDEVWNASDAVVLSTFLAQVQFGFVRSCCQLLAKLTAATSPAFLHAAALGEAALASAAVNENEDQKPTNPSISHLVGDIDPLIDRQEQAYRTIRATIAASCTLGHRSCQVLWGPRGSGKHRMLRLLAQEVRRTPNTFVMELHGRLLRDDEAALGVIAQQLFAFLQSPQSRQLREKHYLLRSGSFGFGQLFHFERRMQEAAAAASGNKEREDTSSRASGGRRNHSTTIAAATNNFQRQPAGAPRDKRVEAIPDASNSGDTEEGEAYTEGNEGDVSDTAIMVTSTTTYLTGGAASALPHLQRALLLLKSQGCNIVVCIRDIDVFGIRCDQLLYVLSGLMHDSDGSNGGGGLSLVLASAAPDIRQLEKRLSSRLTCETRYVPLLPWSLTRLLAATLHVEAQDACYQLRQRALTKERMESLAALRDGATRLRQLRERLPQPRSSAKKRKSAAEIAMEDVQDSMAALEARLHATESKLRELRAHRRHFLGFLDTENNTVAAATGAATAAAGIMGLNGVGNGGGPGAKLGSGIASGWRPMTSPSSTLATSVQGHSHTAPSASFQHTTSVSSNFVAPRSWTVESLHAQPNLTLELQCVFCEELMQQLRLAVAAASPVACGTAMSTPGIESASSVSPSPSSFSLVQRVVSLSTAVELESGTSATVLTALTSVLCKTASGEVDLMGPHGRRVLLRWLRARLQHEPIPMLPEENVVSAVSSKMNISVCPSGLPPKILTCWRESAQTLAPTAAMTASVLTKVGESSAAASLSPSASGLRPPFSISNSMFDTREGTRSASSAAAVSTPMETDSMFHRHNSSLTLPSLSLLPPHLFDLLADGQLVGLGYGSREMMLVLFYMHLHHTTGVKQRAVADLLEDVSSSLGTRAAAALDREAFRYAIRLLCRWRLLALAERHSQSVQLCGSDARLREFLSTILSKQPAWCEAELGLDAREIMRFRNLV